MGAKVQQASVVNLISPKLKDLTKPFHEEDIEWRVQRSGVTHGRPWALVLAYVDARAVQSRLDEVVGPENWTVAYNHIDGGVMCNLSIRCNNEWVTKCDGSPETNIEAFKGGISKALVRAASVWGIGRYLYRLSENFAQFVDKRVDGAREVRIGDQSFYWLPPEMPTWAMPEGVAPKKRGKKIEAEELSENPAPAAPKNVFEEAPASGDIKPEEDDFVGGYVVNFGRKYYGKKLSDMDFKDIEAYRDWLMGDAQKTGKALSGRAADFVEAANAYMNLFRSDKKEAVGQIPF